MKRLWICVVALAVAGAAASSFAEEGDAGAKKPNVVIVFMDNFGWGEPGFNGGGIIRGAPTPRMDSIAREGLRLTNFNVEVQCTPSRSALMTGRYAFRSGNGVVPLGEGAVSGLVQWEHTMAEMFSAAGYATGMYGKWHLGNTQGRFPTDQGFDEWYGIPNTSDESAWSALPEAQRNGFKHGQVMAGKKGEKTEVVRPYDLKYRAEIDGDLTKKAIGFMERSVAANKPFFLYLPYTATHFPTIPSAEFMGKTGNGNWADLLHQIDQYVGRLLDAIERLKVSDDTIFIFTADNGPEAWAHGVNQLTVETGYPGIAGPWRGTLFTGFEAALRVPFAMRWPGKIKPGSESNEVVHAMDLLPTLANVIGAAVPDDRPIDGVNQLDHLTGASKKSAREGFIVYMGNKVFGIKWRHWKLCFKEAETVFSQTRSFETLRLYNLIVDPGETVNVLFPNTWVPRKALALLDEHVASFKKSPPIKAGTPDPYQPPK